LFVNQNLLPYFQQSHQQGSMWLVSKADIELKSEPPGADQPMVVLDLQH